MEKLMDHSADPNINDTQQMAVAVAANYAFEVLSSGLYLLTE